MENAVNSIQEGFIAYDIRNSFQKFWNGFETLLLYKYRRDFTSMSNRAIGLLHRENRDEIENSMKYLFPLRHEYIHNNEIEIDQCDRDQFKQFCLIYFRFLLSLGRSVRNLDELIILIDIAVFDEKLLVNKIKLMEIEIKSKRFRFKNKLFSIASKLGKKDKNFLEKEKEVV